jgi:hypothetical protein
LSEPYENVLDDDAAVPLRPGAGVIAHEIKHEILSD